MAWNTRATYATTDPPVVLADTLQAISSDIRTWGGNVDGGGHSLVNVAGISGASGALAVTGTMSVSGNVTLPAKVGIGSLSPGGAYALSVGGTCQFNMGTNEGAITFVSAGDAGNNVYIEAFNSAMSASATSLNIAGRFGADLPLLNLAAAKVKLSTSIPAYANNAAAISGGLTAGMVYVVSSSNPRQLAIVF